MFSSSMTGLTSRMFSDAYSQLQEKKAANQQTVSNYFANNYSAGKALSSSNSTSIASTMARAPTAKLIEKQAGAGTTSVSTGSTPKALSATNSVGASNLLKTKTMNRAFMTPGGISANMSKDLNNNIIPGKPAAPSAPRITEQPFDFYINQERTRNGMLSTFLGRNLDLPQTKMRRAGLSNYLNK